MSHPNLIRFVLDDREHLIDFALRPELRPSTTVLQYLRSLRGHKGVKEGCAEGDCGACTIVLAEPNNQGGLRYYAVNSCILFLPMIHGKQVITVENLARVENGEQVLHPVQQQLVELHGSQCGYCTPGIVMSLFALYKNHKNPDRNTVEEALAGNLCRCTGYRPIIEAGLKACSDGGIDHFSTGEKNMAAMLLRILRETPSVSLHSAGQQYFRPATAEEALRLRAEHPQCIVINGSTDVALRQTKQHEVLPALLDLSGVQDWQAMHETTEDLRVGSGCRLEILRSFAEQRLPVLHQMLDVFASLQIRNVATAGGNIGSASPIGDLLPVFMALNTSVVLTSAKQERRLPLKEFILGYRKTALQADEIITALMIPKPSPKALLWTHKISKRKDLDISTLSACFRLQLDDDGRVEDIALVYGGMAECTRNASIAEQYLRGKSWSAAFVHEAANLLADDFKPISDARAGKEFRTLAARNLLIKFFNETQHIQ